MPRNVEACGAPAPSSLSNVLLRIARSYCANARMPHDAETVPPPPKLMIRLPAPGAPISFARSAKANGYPSLNPHSEIATLQFAMVFVRMALYACAPAAEAMLIDDVCAD